MQRRFLLLGGMAVLASCGGRLNPLTWFKRRPKAVDETGFKAPTDPRGLMARVTSVKLEQTSSGAILRVVGLAPAQGYYDAALVGVPVDADGVKVFEFRVAEPAATTGPGPEQSREIAVAVALSFYQLGQISALRVVAAENAMVLRP